MARRETLAIPGADRDPRLRSYSTALADAGEESAFSKARRDRDAEMLEGTQFLFDLTKMKDPSLDHSKMARLLFLGEAKQSFQQKEGDTRLEMSRQYVPKYVVDFFEKRCKPIAIEHEEMFYAAVLFVDVSGFTKLTEKLSQNVAKTAVNIVSESKKEQQKGKAKDHDDDKQTMERGAEQLVEHLNEYFDQIIKIIERWGGDVIKFAGDAMLCTFDTNCATDDRSKLQKAVVHACSCAEELHAIDAKVRTVDTVQLKLHIGIGAGKLRFVFVGGHFDRWEYLVADTETVPGPIFQIGEAEPVAEPDETVVHKHAFELVSDHFIKFYPARNKETKALVGYRVDKLKRPPENPTTLAPPDASLPEDAVYLIENFVPAAIKNRLDGGAGGSSKWMCDLRRVTILFINVQGLKTSSPNYLKKLQFSMEVIQSCLYAEEGSVNKYLSDDKGTTLIAGFGLPPLSHRDDPLRGVRAAIRIMQRMVEESPGWEEEQQDGGVHRNIFASVEGALLPAIGITTGNCFCGIVGGSRRKEYTMMGDIVNLAARLMQFARGDVVVDKNTYDESVKEINYDIRPAIRVKGKKDPIPIFSPDPERNTIASLSLVRERRRTAFVGRDEQIKLFNDHVVDNHLGRWDKAKQLWRDKPEGKIVHVTGEVGIGKSRISDQFMNIAAGDTNNPDMLVVMGEGKENDKYCFNCWVPVVLNLIALLNDIVHRTVGEDRVVDLPDGQQGGKRQTVAIKRTASEQWQEYHQRRLDEHDINLPLAAREDAGRQERVDVVRRQSQRYQRLRGMPSTRLKKDFPKAVVDDYKKMLLQTLGDDTPQFAQNVDLLFEVLQVSSTAPHSRGERGPQAIVGPRLKQANRHEQQVRIDEDIRALMTKNRRMVIHLILAIIEKVNSHYPLMIVIEDANFMEDESWDLCAHLCRSKIPIIFTIVENVQRRDQWREKQLASFCADITCDPARVLDLNTPRMSEGDIIKLAKAHWDAQNIPMEVLDMLARRSEGNPLFCERLMDTLSARQIVKVRHDSIGKAHVLLMEKDQLYSVRIDPGLMTMIRARLDKLPASLQRTLKLASIIASCNLMLSNPIFTVHLLSFMDHSYKKRPEQMQAEELQKRLLVLEEEKEIIEKVELPGFQPSSNSPQDIFLSTAYRFRSPLFRDVVYRSLPFAERQQLHSILAQSIQFQMSHVRQIEDPELHELMDRHWRRWNELIAEHFSLSGDERSAFVRCLLVGEHCLHNNSDKRAAELLEKALNSYARVDLTAAANADVDAPQALRFMGTYAHHLYGLATFRLGLMDQAKQSLEVALKGLDRTIPNSTFGIYKSTMSQRFAKTIRKKTFQKGTGGNSIAELRTVNPAVGETSLFMAEPEPQPLRRIGSNLIATRWIDKSNLSGISEDEFNMLLAKVYTWLAVVYFEGNEKEYGDWASAHAISLFQRSAHISASDMGLVSLAYAHACVNSQLRGQTARAVGYQTKALAYFRKLTDDTYTHARVDVLWSIAQFDAACGRFDDSIHKLKQCINMSKDIGDLRVWEKCITQLGHSYLILGSPMDAMTMFVAVCQSCKSATADRSSTEQLALHGLAQSLLALGMLELADESLVFLQGSSGMESSRVMTLWLLGRYERALLEAHRVLNLAPQSFTSMWMQYWTLVSTLDVLFAQWARLLSAMYDIKNAGPVSTLVDDPPPASLNTETQPEIRPGILGLGEPVESLSRKKSRRGTGRPSKVFVDDLANIHSLERIQERLPTVHKPIKKLIEDLEAFAAVFSFASHTAQVYNSMFHVFKHESSRQKHLARMWKPLHVNSGSIIPRDKAVAAWFHFVACWDQSKEPGNDTAFAKTQLSELADSKRVADALVYRRIHIIESSSGLNHVTTNTPEGIGKVLTKINSLLISELSAQRTELRITFDDIDELDSDFKMETVESYIQSDEERQQLVDKVSDGENTQLLDWDWIRTIKLILKTQQFKSWQLDAQVQDDMLDHSL
eukprot:c11967_g1_i1.p1 GENE.c11967_g1_i1~~c11967_g1_i1.p1  ORF type:complete len:1972 (+),score=487.19 c11967_g1_i1:65-5980(+)